MPGISPGRSARSSRVASGTARLTRPANPAGTAPVPGVLPGPSGPDGPDPHLRCRSARCRLRRRHPRRGRPACLGRPGRGGSLCPAGCRGRRGPAARPSSRPGVQHRGGPGDDLRLGLPQGPVPERRPGPGQLHLQDIRQVQQALGRPAGLAQHRAQLPRGELLPRRRHPRRPLRGTAGRGTAADPLAEKLHRDWRHISFVRLLRTQALRTPGLLPRPAPSPPAAPGSAELALRHYRTARPPSRAESAVLAILMAIGLDPYSKRYVLPHSAARHMIAAEGWSQ